MLVARRDPPFHVDAKDAAPLNPHVYPPPRASRMARTVTAMQLIGSLLAVPVGIASAYSFYREKLSGLSIATIYTRYLPVTKPGKVICLGLNYLEHVKEGAQRDNIPKFPTIFMRGNSSLVPHGEPIIRPKASETLDYEAELIFIVGKRAKHLTLDNAYSCIAGYSCGNEGSVREFQRKTTQWDMGKNFDRTGGFGPWMVTADELPPGGKGLKIQTRLNGEVMQSDNTDNMMFPVAETIAYVTQGMTLEPGDIVFTGTPSGVGHARKPNPVWMKPDDTCEIDIEGVGVLVNPIADEK